jgi:hypothetical protein
VFRFEAKNIFCLIDSLNHGLRRRREIILKLTSLSMKIIIILIVHAQGLVPPPLKTRAQEVPALVAPVRVRRTYWSKR